MRHPSPTLVPPAARRGALAVVAGSVVVFAVLAARYAGGSDARWFDDHAADVIDDVTSRGRLLRLLLELGSPTAVVVTGVVVAAVCLLLRRPRAALLALLGPGLTGLVTTFGKPLIGRTLRGEFAFPSGHTGGATATALTLAVIVVAALQLDARRSLAAVLAVGTAAAALWTVLVVAANWHYATDAIGGAAVAFASVLGVALALDALAERWAGRVRPGAGTARPAS